VAGDARYFRRAQIIGVSARAPHFPLNLSTGDRIPRDHPVRRVETLCRNQRQACPHPVTQLLSKHSLRTSGSQELVAFRDRVNRGKKIARSVDKAIDDALQQVEQKSTSERKCNV